MPFCIQFVEHQCGADVRHQCPEGKYCCSNGCMNVCRKPDDRCPANNYQNMNYDVLLALCQKPCSSGCANDEMCCDSGGCGLVCLPGEKTVAYGRGAKYSSMKATIPSYYYFFLPSLSNVYGSMRVIHVWNTRISLRTNYQLL